jgi:hypothetical protein
MRIELPARPAALPVFLRRLSTDEYEPAPYTAADRRVIRRLRITAERAQRKLRMSTGDYFAGRMGTSAGLRALNAEWNDEFYEVAAEAETDRDAAQHAFHNDYPIIDIQTHFVADRQYAMHEYTTGIFDVYRAVMPDFFVGMDDRPQFNFGMADYLRCVFLETENAVAVLTSPPGRGQYAILTNDEMAITRRLSEELGARGRILNHTVVHPDAPEELEAMSTWNDTLSPAAWKVYTHGHMAGNLVPHGTNWMLDDDKTGIPFVQRAQELGTKLICAHKGLAFVVDTGSPRDLGPISKAFPDMTFIAYHSGYEMPVGDNPPEGPYTEETANIGVNRMVTTVRKEAVPPGSNLYAELGTTWFCLVRRPVEAAHVLGKLLTYFGPDNIVWGTDSIWYGPAQQMLDAFKVFQIPRAMREEFGYPELTPEIREKILSKNAAKLYGLDLEEVRTSVASDDLAWAHKLISRYEKSGTDIWV